MPPFLLSFPARFYDLLAGLLGATMTFEAFVSYLTTDLLFSNDRAQHLLDWKPEYSLAQGVEEMVSEYRTRRKRAET